MVVSVEEEDLCRRRNGLEMACRHGDDDDHDDGGQIMMLKLLLLWVKETVEKDSEREVIEARVRRILITTRSDNDELSMINVCLLLILLVVVSMIFCYLFFGFR